MKKKTKTLLYLETRSLPPEKHAEINAAIEAGYDVVMATQNPSLYRSYGFAHFIEAPLGDYDRAESIILKYISQHDLDISGILFWKDREVELGVRLNKKLRLPTMSLSAALNVRNKASARKAMSKVNGVNPRYKIVTTEESFLTALKKIGTPCLLKPAGNSGSRGIFNITSTENALEIYREFIRYNAAQSGDMYRYYADTALLEEVLRGTEQSVSGFVLDGQITILAIIDKKFDRDLLLQYQNIVPSQLTPQQQEKVRAVTKTAVEAVGIDYCGFHVDIMLTNEGPKVLEIGGRLGGEFINSHLIPTAFPGINPYKIFIEVVQGQKPNLDDLPCYTRSRTRAGVRIILSPKVGKIKQILGLEEIQRDPHVRSFLQMHGVGSQMELPKTKFKSYEIGYIFAECALQDDMNQILDNLNNKIQVHMEE